MMIASSGFFFHTSVTTTSAILSAAPVFSSRVPTSAPKIITMPILVNVPEKPAPITPGMSLSGIPAITPKIRDTAIIDRKG